MAWNRLNNPYFTHPGFDFEGFLEERFEAGSIPDPELDVAAKRAIIRKYTSELDLATRGDLDRASEFAQGYRFGLAFAQAAIATAYAGCPDAWKRIVDEDDR